MNHIFAQSRFKFVCQILNGELKQLPKWLNLAKSGHTDFSGQRCELKSILILFSIRMAIGNSARVCL